MKRFIKLHMRGIYVKLFLLFTAFGLGSKLKAQGNPGYMGKTRIMNVGVEAYFPGLDVLAVKYKQVTSVTYETSRNSWLSLYGNLRWGDVELDKEDFERIDVGYVDAKTSQYTQIRGGNLGLSIFEVGGGIRIYSNNAGSLAPFGPYLGIELAYSRIGVQDDVTWSSQALQSPKVTAGYSSINLGMTVGSRRILFDKLAVDYSLGAGYPIYSTGADNSEERYNAKDAMHATSHEYFRLGRIVRLNLGVGYFF